MEKGYYLLVEKKNIKVVEIDPTKKKKEVVKIVNNYSVIKKTDPRYASYEVCVDDANKNFFYVVKNGNRGLSFKVIDCSNPKKLEVVGKCKISTYPYKIYPITIGGDKKVCWLPSYKEDVVEVVDISNPEEPFIACQWEIDDYIKTLCPSDNGYVFMACQKRGLLVLKPFFEGKEEKTIESLIMGMGQYALKGTEKIEGFYIKKNYAYIICNIIDKAKYRTKYDKRVGFYREYFMGALVILDVSNLKNIQKIGNSYLLNDLPFDIFVSDKDRWGYISNRHKGKFVAFDFSNISNLKKVIEHSIQDWDYTDADKMSVDEDDKDTIICIPERERLHIICVVVDEKKNRKKMKIKRISTYYNPAGGGWIKEFYKLH